MLRKTGFLLFAILLAMLAACGGTEEEFGSEGDAEDFTNYSDAVNYTITGIEPGAGITVTTEKAIEEYDNLAGWELEQGSTGAMVTELGKAIDNEDPIIVTGWNPHWKFAKFDNLKYLDDPKGIYGGEEVIKTIVRKGLKQEKPNAYKLLDQFQWEVEDMESIMYESAENDVAIEDAAIQWVQNNPDKVEAWTEGVEDVDGVTVELVSTPWDSERASANVVAEVMRQKGFDVTITEVDVAVTFEAIATGEGDASLAPWMPITHQSFYEAYEDGFEDLGENLTGAKIGLVVPDYMDIDSIEDLKPKQ